MGRPVDATAVVYLLERAGEGLVGYDHDSPVLDEVYDLIEEAIAVVLRDLSHDAPWCTDDPHEAGLL